MMIVCRIARMKREPRRSRGEGIHDEGPVKAHPFRAGNYIGAGRLEDGVVIRAGAAEGDIVSDRAVQERRILGDHADIAPQALLVAASCQFRLRKCPVKQT